MKTKGPLKKGTDSNAKVPLVVLDDVHLRKLLTNLIQLFYYFILSLLRKALNFVWTPAERLFISVWILCDTLLMDCFG